MKLSIITPVYNRADCIRQCVNSVATQSIPPGWKIEQIITDDGSTDNTPKEIKSLHSEYPELINAQFLEKNRGTNAARNKAIAEATGEWIVILDSDDEMLPEAVQTICSTIDANPDIRHFLFSTDDTANARAMFGETEHFNFQDFLLGKVSGDFVHVMRRETLQTMPFNERLRIFEGIFFLHYYKLAGDILFTNKALYHRDRTRTDHATFELNMVSRKAIATKAAAYKLQRDLYSDDYRATKDGLAILAANMKYSAILHTLLGEYAEAEDLNRELSLSGHKERLMLKITRKTHTGPLVRSIVCSLTRLKHLLRRHRLQQ